MPTYLVFWLFLFSTSGLGKTLFLVPWHGILAGRQQLNFRMELAVLLATLIWLQLLCLIETVVLPWGCPVGRQEVFVQRVQGEP
jgi:hypothetical protein